MSTGYEGGIPGRPVNVLLAVLDQPEREALLVDALIENGFDRDAIHVLRGPEAAEHIDRIVEEHGLSGAVARALAVWESPNDDVDRYEGALRAGGCVVGVDLRNPEQRDHAHEVLKAHGTRFINFYGRWTIRPVEP